jgi:hypothetical protein
LRKLKKICQRNCGRKRFPKLTAVLIGIIPIFYYYRSFSECTAVLTNKRPQNLILNKKAIDEVKNRTDATNN